MKTFTEAVEHLLRGIGWEDPLFPEALLRCWEEFIKDCTAGYDWDLYEYDKDLSVRGALAVVLNAEVLTAYPEHWAFRKRVDRLDHDFKQLLQEDVARDEHATWWERGILKKAGAAYAVDLTAIYEVDVEACE